MTIKKYTLILLCFLVFYAIGFSQKNEILPIRSDTRPEALQLLEYVDYTPTDLTLSLGTLKAAPESRNYALATFLANHGKLNLQHKDTPLKIKSFRLTIFDKAAQATSHWVKVAKKDKWLDYLSQLSYENSIYFDKLMIEKDKQTFYLGQVFLFKIGKEFLTE